jgi:hypothetical protein
MSGMVLKTESPKLHEDELFAIKWCLVGILWFESVIEAGSDRFLGIIWPSDSICFSKVVLKFIRASL